MKELSMKTLMEQELKENSSVSINENDETNIRAITAVWSNMVLQLLGRGYLYDKTSYKKKMLETFYQLS